ncbi:MAG: MotA/TolQ/ExbB proton channel family protein [Desulfuromonas sp.]|nr:MotA/TolQ/ExbB proton channel family protein [Desulfuromonas sp.]
MKAMIITLILVVLTTLPALGQDQRQRAQALQQQQQQVVAAAEQEQLRAETLATKQRQQLLADRTALRQAVKTLRGDVADLKQQTRSLKKQLSRLTVQQTALQTEQQQRSVRLQELLGFIRVSAKESDALLQHSQINALRPGRTEVLNVLQQQERFPGMDDVRALSALLLDEMTATAEVQIVRQTILDRQGEQRAADVLMLGDFSAAYRTVDESGFLLYSPPSGRLFALSQLPGRRWQKQIERYLDGESASAPIDIGRGASLRQLNYRTGLTDQLGQGGFIVWPIVLIGAVALVLIVERSWFLRRNRFDADALFNTIEPLVADGDWSGCESACQHSADKPLPRVLSAGLRYRTMGREDLENALQEAILGEIPRLERFLSTLAVLASIAPLLGLLGTVTGMINTFQVITFHGTGDPRLMSSGISEALITTMLGLGVAIPIMLCHSLLSRRVETLIAQLEEKSIRFVNVVCKARFGGGESSS